MLAAAVEEAEGGRLAEGVAPEIELLEGQEAGVDQRHQRVAGLGRVGRLLSCVFVCVCWGGGG